MGRRLAQNNFFSLYLPLIIYIKALFSFSDRAYTCDDIIDGKETKVMAGELILRFWVSQSNYNLQISDFF